MNYSCTLAAIGAFAALASTITADDKKSIIPRVGDTTKRQFATIEGFRKLSGAKVNQEVEVSGVAGYIDDKGGDPCIWLLKEGIVALVLIEKWPNYLVGQRIQVIGKITRIPEMPWNVQVRHLGPGHFILTRVRLKDGKFLYNEESKNRAAGKG